MIVDPTQLRSAVEPQHARRANLVQTAPVRETSQGQPVWEDVVHVFDIEGNPNASRAYAWASPIEASEKRRSFTVLQLGAIKTPVDAVRTAVVAEHRQRGVHE